MFIERIFPETYRVINSLYDHDVEFVVKAESENEAELIAKEELRARCGESCYIWKLDVECQPTYIGGGRWLRDKWKVHYSVDEESPAIPKQELEEMDHEDLMEKGWITNQSGLYPNELEWDINPEFRNKVILWLKAQDPDTYWIEGTKLKWDPGMHFC